jgi:energy-coupling factor transporter transmembrane protein EcfT
MVTNNPKYRIYLSLLLILSAIFIPGWWVIFALPVFILLILLFDRGALSSLGRKKFWIGWLLTAIVFSLIAGIKKDQFWHFSLSPKALEICLRLFIRTFFVISAMSLLRRNVSPKDFTKILCKLGLGQTAALFPFSFQLLPSIMDNSKRIIILWYRRGGLRKKQFKNLLLLLTSLQFLWVREAEDLAQALFLKQKELNSDRE